MVNSVKSYRDKEVILKLIVIKPDISTNWVINLRLPLDLSFVENNISEKAKNL